MKIADFTLKGENAAKPHNFSDEFNVQSQKWQELFKLVKRESLCAMWALSTEMEQCN